MITRLNNALIDVYIIKDKYREVDCTSIIDFVEDKFNALLIEMTNEVNLEYMNLQKNEVIFKLTFIKDDEIGISNLMEKLKKLTETNENVKIIIEISEIIKGEGSHYLEITQLEGFDGETHKKQSLSLRSLPLCDDVIKNNFNMCIHNETYSNIKEKLNDVENENWTIKN